MGAFVASENETIIAGFWREHAKVDCRTRKSNETLSLLSPCCEKEYMDKIFYAGITFFETFVQVLLSMSINLLLA